MNTAAVMTFEDRVQALAPLGFTPRQTRFLVTVALHGGFCLRRQYAAFAALQYGHPVRDFLDALVVRALARRFSYRRDRGFLYHLHGRAVYRAIGQDDNRNRRLTGPALIARKLMLLDAVIGQPDVEWFATEDDKVSLFTTRFQVARAELPQRSYTVHEGDRHAETTRFFVHKLPIYLVGAPAVPHFICLATNPGGGDCEQFLRDHARLLRQLSAWTLVVVAPQHTASVAAYERAFERSLTDLSSRDRSWPQSELLWYFQTRNAVEHEQLTALSVADLARFRQVSATAVGTLIDQQYQEWLRTGDQALAKGDQTSAAAGVSGGRLEVRQLPHRYSQFGDLPGVC